MFDWKTIVYLNKKNIYQLKKYKTTFYSTKFMELCNSGFKYLEIYIELFNI